MSEWLGSDFEDFRLPRPFGTNLGENDSPRVAGAYAGEVLEGYAGSCGLHHFKGKCVNLSADATQDSDSVSDFEGL